MKKKKKHNRTEHTDTDIFRVTTWVLLAGIFCIIIITISTGRFGVFSFLSLLGSYSYQSTLGPRFA